MSEAASKPAHSPGPWRYVRDGFAVVDAKSRLVFGSLGYQYQEGQEEANFALAAAAPELRDALEQLMGCFQPHPHHQGIYLILTVDVDRALPIVRAALAKSGASHGH